MELELELEEEEEEEGRRGKSVHINPNKMNKGKVIGINFTRPTYP